LSFTARRAIRSALYEICPWYPAMEHQGNEVGA
jgi:hypothetical protein